MTCIYISDSKHTHTQNIIELYHLYCFWMLFKKFFTPFDRFKKISEWKYRWFWSSLLGFFFVFFNPKSINKKTTKLNKTLFDWGIVIFYFCLNLSKKHFQNLKIKWLVLTHWFNRWSSVHYNYWIFQYRKRRYCEEITSVCCKELVLYAHSNKKNKFLADFYFAI